MQSSQFSFSQRTRPHIKSASVPHSLCLQDAFCLAGSSAPYASGLLEAHPTLTFADRVKHTNEDPSPPTLVWPFCFSSNCLVLQLQGTHTHTQRLCGCPSSITGACKELPFRHHQARVAVNSSGAMTGKIDPYQFWKQVQTFRKNIWGLRYLRQDQKEVYWLKVGISLWLHGFISS